MITRTPLHRFVGAALGALLILASFAGPAAAKQPPVTKLGFKLVSHQLTVGDSVDVTVHVKSRSAKAWVGVAGATISVKVDGVEVATGVSDDAGMAVIPWVVAAEGGHVMKVVFAGDDLHKRAQRAQGFNATAAPV